MINFGDLSKWTSFENSILYILKDFPHLPVWAYAAPDFEMAGLAIMTQIRSEPFAMVGALLVTDRHAFAVVNGARRRK